MGDKKDIVNDIWAIMCKVYRIGPDVVKSEKQELFIKEIVEYMDNSMPRKLKKDSKEKKC
jgi:hypothetical protein